MKEIEHNRRCFIADLDFGDDREALEQFFEAWLELIRPWCRPGWWDDEIHGGPGITWNDGQMPFTVLFGTLSDFVSHLRPVSITDGVE